MKKKMLVTFCFLASLIRLLDAIPLPSVSEITFVEPEIFEHNVVMKRGLKIHKSLQLKSLKSGVGTVLGIVDHKGTVGFLPSSFRYKTDIRSIGDVSDAADKIMQLRPVSFIYKNDASGTIQYGLIAEEVAKVLPELVSYSQEDNKPFSVRYGAIAPMLLHVVQKQEEKIRRMDSQEVYQNRQIDVLIDRIAQLEQKVKELEQKAH